MFATAAIVPGAATTATAATVLHLPPVTATYHTPIVMEANVQCDDECTGVILYKPAGEAPSSLSTFAAAPMAPVVPEPATGRVLRGVIPGEAVDTRGVEYLIAVDDGASRTWWPAAPVSPSLAAGHRVHVPEAPHVVHAPLATAYYGQAVSLEALSNCVHDACTAVVEWRTTRHEWRTMPMRSDYDATTGRMTYAVTLPSEAATTEGIDYRISASDGHVTDTTPTYHITVLTPTAILHQPQVTALYGQAIPIEAVVACATATCTAELSYRITGTGLLADGEWKTVPMTPLGASTSVGSATAVQRWSARVDGADVTTKGIDYRIRATDGTTTAFAPGTAYAGTTVVQSDGISTYWFHVHVAEPVRLVHVPVVHAPYHEAISITAQANCSTGACSATLGYRTSTGLDTVAGVLDYAAGGPAFTETTMSVALVEDLGPAGQVLSFTAHIPAEVVDTNGVDYWIRVSDGDTTAWYPGTSYIGGLGSLDGTRVAWQHVEVSHRPVVIHTPAVSYTQGSPRPMTATTVVGTGTAPTATLWARLTTDAAYQAIPMTVVPSASGPGTTRTYDLAAAIPASLTSSGAPIEYVVDVHDGHQHGYAPLTAASPAEPMLGYRIVVNAPVIIL